MCTYNKVFFVFLTAMLSLTGCNIKSESKFISSDTVSESDIEGSVKNNTEAPISETMEPILFQHPFLEDKMKLEYTYLKADVFENLTENGYDLADIQCPSTQYPIGDSAYDKMNSLEDYVDQNGNVNNEYIFLVLKFEMYNVNAIGLDSPDGFYINAISLAQPGLETYDSNSGKLPDFTVYDIAYFSLHGSDEKNYFHYVLPRGERKSFELGYFVKKSDIENNMLVLSCGGRFEPLKIQL